MSNYDPNAGVRRRRANRYSDPNQAEPSMSAPSPMPGKPAASYVKPQPPEPQPQADWQPPQEPDYSASAGWGNAQYPVNQGYVYPQQSYPQPSQGVPMQPPPQQYGAWQQGYVPAQPQQPIQQGYQQPAGRGWSQPYPVQEQGGWQGGYSVNQWGGGYSPMQENEPVQEAAGGAGHANGSGGRKPAWSLSGVSSVKLIAAAAVVVIAVVLVVSLLTREHRNNEIYSQVTAYNDLYCEGVYVDGIHLGGMTREEAREAVQKSAQLKCDEWHVRLETAASEYVGEINSYHLGMTVHVDDALEEAWQQGRSGDVNDRKAAMDALKETPYQGSTALPSSDTAAIDRILNEIAANVYIPAEDAYIASFTPNATNPFVLVEGTVGRYLDVASIKEQVYDMVSRMETGVILIEPTPLYPSITLAELQRQTTLIGSAYTQISSTSPENRNLNIERACDLITGTIIEPGKTFSFNGIVGKRSEKNGFYLAIEYAYGKQVEGYGGGVCQVSSTIYIAAVRANMEIVKREQHSLEVGYTTFGLDATVNYDGKKIDFVFRNSTETPIYVVTKVMKKPKVDKDHYLVICDIYGAALEPGVTYDLVAVTTEVPIPEPTIVPDTKAEHVIYTDEMHTVEGSVGYEVDSYKIKYVNGEAVEQTFMYHDTYKAVQPVTYVGVSERPLATWEPW